MTTTISNQTKKVKKQPIGKQWEANNKLKEDNMQHNDNNNIATTINHNSNNNSTESNHGLSISKPKSKTKV